MNYNGRTPHGACLLGTKSQAGTAAAQAWTTHAVLLKLSVFRAINFGAASKSIIARWLTSISLYYQAAFVCGSIIAVDGMIL